MMDVIAQIAVRLNAVANALGRWLLAPLAALPGWLFATLVSVSTGLLLLVVFKYTSNQRMIRRVRNDVKAHLLVLKLFKESAWVSFRAQGRILLGAVRLVILAMVPMLVLFVPVSLLWGQLALWYQARPLRIGEDALLTLKLNGRVGSAWPEVRLVPADAAQVTLGPVRVLSKREVCWNIRVRENGYHRLVFEVDGQAIQKDLAVGNGLMRVSIRRPGWRWSEILLHPCEPPCGPDSPVQSIEIDYPQRSSWTNGTDSWMIYWFAVSMVAAICFRPWMNVEL